jgi:hypothetical protein
MGTKMYTPFNRSYLAVFLPLPFTRHSPHLPSSSPSLGASKLRCYLLTIDWIVLGLFGEEG